MNARLEPPHTVGGAIARRARRAPERPALLGADATCITYGELARTIAAAREELERAGLRRHDRVGVVVHPDARGARLLVALACNITVVPIDPALAAPALAALVEATGIKALATLSAAGTPELELLAARAPAATLRPTRAADVALLLRPGTLTHWDLRSLAGKASVQAGLGIAKDDRVACLAPLHCAGVETALFVPLILGASVSIARPGEAAPASVVCVTAADLARLPAAPSARMVLCVAGTLGEEDRAAAELRLGVPARALRAADLKEEGRRELLRPAPAPVHSTDLPGLGPADDLLELEVRDIWRRLLARDDIGFDESFFEAGGDSLLATQMLLELESLAGRPYPESELVNLTIRHIAKVLKARMPEERSCIRQARAGSGTPLFFCHGDFQARGLYAHQLAALMPEDQPVYLLHPQREPSAGTSAEELAERYLPEVLRVAAGQPVILGGYCNGGYVAWHLAHLLRVRGVQVAALLLVETPSFNARPLVRKLAAALRAAGRVLPGKAGRLVREDAMRAVWSLYRHGVTDVAFRLLPRGSAGAAAPGAAPSWWVFVRSMATRYVPPAIDVPVYCILAEEASRLDTEPACWRALAPSVTPISVPGTHVSAVISHRRALAAALAGAIREATTRREAGRIFMRTIPCRAAPAGQGG